MGIGSSRGYYEPISRRRSPVPKRRRGKKRRSFLRRFRSAPTTQPLIPIGYRSPYRYSYGSGPFISPISPYGSLPPAVYPGYMPMSYNNYRSPYYMSPYQPMMIPPQQIQPMMMPQQVPQSQPMMMPQPSMVPQPMAMPQQVPQSQPMSMPQQVSPSVFFRYSTGVPFSTPYAQQQPQVQPVYSNVGVSSSVPIGMTGQSSPFSSSYPGISGTLSTDWTGGGKISPGFLGPPI